MIPLLIPGRQSYRSCDLYSALKIMIIAYL